MFFPSDRQRESKRKANLSPLDPLAQSVSHSLCPPIRPLNYCQSIKLIKARKRAPARETPGRAIAHPSAPPSAQHLLADSLSDCLSPDASSEEDVHMRCTPAAAAVPPLDLIDFLLPHERRIFSPPSFCRRGIRDGLKGGGGYPGSTCNKTDFLMNMTSLVTGRPHPRQQKGRSY